MKEKLLRGRHALGLAARIIVSVVIIAVIIWKYDDLKHIDVRALIDGTSSLLAAAAAVWGVYLLKSLVFVVPASLIYIAVGMAFPPLTAVAINALGILIEVCSTYLFGVILGGPYVINKLEKAKYGDKILELHGKGKLSAIFAIRVLPVFPIDLVSLFLGAVRMRFLPYLLLSLGGILPRVILFTVLGDGIYDYIPMDKFMLAAVILLPIALVAWVISYAVKSRKAEESSGKPPYEPLRDSRRNVIFDTDMGPDCDDAGAFALLFHYVKKYDLNLLGAANCTSNRYANGTIRAIAEHFGCDELPVGQYSGPELLPDGKKYNEFVTKKYCRYPSSATAAQTELEFYRKLLKKSEDGSVTVIAVGPLSNISRVLREDGELFNRKVDSIVMMGGAFPAGKEFNIECDPSAAKTVFENFKGTVVCSGFEIGKDVMTGFAAEHEGDPVFDSYHRYLGGKAPYLRDSWDLTAVNYAFEGCGEYYALSKPMKITVDDSGKTSAVKSKYSKHYYLLQKAADDVIATGLNALLEPPAAEEKGIDIP